MTSHDVVARLRRFLKQQTGSKVKVGHAGTLDPMATGVLVLCLGDATRLSEYVMHTTRAYRAVVRFGISTDSHDADGNITQQQPVDHLTPDSIQAILPDFTGEIDQIPPMYSAIKQGGKKLYELAREGKTVQRKPRRVTIHDIQIQHASPPDFTLQITCESGTYIRSLARDLGDTLGTGAHLTALSRIQSGTFHLDEAIKLETLIQTDNWQHHLIPPSEALSHHPELTLTAKQVDDIQHGRFIPRDPDSTHTQIMAYLPNGRLLAILTARENQWKPHKVFSSQI